MEKRIMRKVVSFRPVGKRPTMDLTMKSHDHNFIANGLVTSNSHAVSYAFLSYATAYYKVHFTHNFFLSLFRFSKHEQKPLEEIKDILRESRLWNIALIKPSLAIGNSDFELDKNKNVVFGLIHIKQIGESSVEELQHFKEVRQMHIFLLQLCDHRLSKRVVEHLIQAGALDHFEDGLNRNERLSEHELFNEFTKKEIGVFKEYKGTVYEFVTKSIDESTVEVRKSVKEYVPNKTRRQNLRKCLSKYESNPKVCGPKQIIGFEQKLLGISIYGTMAEIKINKKTTHKLIDIPGLQNNTKVVVGAVLDSIRPWTTKKGDEMLFLTISDATHTLDSCTMFSDVLYKYKEDLEIGAALLIKGQKYKEGITINEVSEL